MQCQKTFDIFLHRQGEWQFHIGKLDSRVTCPALQVAYKLSKECLVMTRGPRRYSANDQMNRGAKQT